MSTTSKIGFYLAQGDMAIVLPLLYKKYKRKPYTITEATANIDGFYAGIHLKMHHLNIVEKAPRKEFEKIRPQRWQLTELACSALKRHLKGEKSKHKIIPYCFGSQNTAYNMEDELYGEDTQ